MTVLSMVSFVNLYPSHFLKDTMRGFLGEKEIIGTLSLGACSGQTSGSAKDGKKDAKIMK